MGFVGTAGIVAGGYGWLSRRRYAGGPGIGVVIGVGLRVRLGLDLFQPGQQFSLLQQVAAGEGVLVVFDGDVDVGFDQRREALVDTRQVRQVDGAKQPGLDVKGGLPQLRFQVDVHAGE